MARWIAIAAALVLSTASYAQGGAPPAQQVQLLAPQLVAFSGSVGNFESLVNGLTSAAPVTLTTLGGDGTLQIVTFVPGTMLSVVDTARVLESARQSLITRGIAFPTGQQLAAALMGGTVFAPSGSIAIPGVLTGSIISPTPILVRSDALLLPPASGVSNVTPAQFQALRNALAAGTGVTITTPTGTGTDTRSVTFAPTGVRMSEFEVNQALQLATLLLAQQGVLDPTAEQLRAALFGGTLATAGGSAVALQGVLQGRVRNTSDSRQLNTSASPSGNTSDSRVLGTSNTPANVTMVGAPPSVGAPVNRPGGTGPLAPAASAARTPGTGASSGSTAPSVPRPGAR